MSEFPRSYSQEVDKGWSSQRSFLEILGYEINCVVMFGSMVYGSPRFINIEKEIALITPLRGTNSDKRYDEAICLLNNLPSSTVASDVDFLIISNNSHQVSRKLSHAAIPHDRPTLFGLSYLSYIRTGFPELGKLINNSTSKPFSNSIPYAEIYIQDEDFYKWGMSNFIKYCNGGNKIDEDAFRLSAFMQAFRLGRVIEGSIPSEIADLSREAEDAFYRCRIKNAKGV